jgi:2-iminobutanoate/2-iminopropanoate deaminase
MIERIPHPERRVDEGKIASAIRCGDWLFISGHGPLDLLTGQYVPGTIVEETARTLDHIGKILGAAGGGPGNVVKCTCYLSDLSDFEGFNSEFLKFFAPSPPTRTTSQAALLRGIRVEIDAIAFIPSAGTC